MACQNQWTQNSAGVDKVTFPKFWPKIGKAQGF